MYLRKFRTLFDLSFIFNINNLLIRLWSQARYTLISNYNILYLKMVTEFKFVATSAEILIKWQTGINFI